MPTDASFCQAQQRTLTKERNTAVSNDIHDHVNAAWNNLAREMEAQPRMSMRAAERRARHSQRRPATPDTRPPVLDHLLDQFGEDLGQPVPA
ncbi:hypothetical protein ACIHFB_45375 [Streptomyces sp. NPDC051963]|uniref:hypothetical protein n=1 Tax=Streptomyces sp. NPDC051963 TaxID=3365678 RepID=UPI0037D6895B